MLIWHFFSAPIMTGMSLFALVPVLLSSLFFCLGGSGFYIFDWELFSFLGVSFVFPFLFDKMSLLFSLVVVIISFSVMLFTISYMSGDNNLEYFIYMVVLFVLSMNFLIFVPHLLVLLLGWDGLGLTSYLLVIYYQNDSSLAAGMVTAMSNRVGDALLILGGSWSFLSGHWNFVYSSYSFVWFVGLVIMVGSMTKSAQVPFSAWLPAAMAAPTPVSSLVHSSTLVTAGVYLLIRFYSSLSLYFYFCFFIFYVGVVTCLMASFSALYENDLKKVIALSTLSQLGVMVMAIGLGFPMLAFFHLITHALFKALLFVCAGTIIHSKQNNQDIRLMGNIWSSMPVTCTALNVANLALCGFPFMAGFYSKDLIVESFMFNNLPFSTSFFLLTSVCLTSGYSIRMAIFTLWSPFKSVSVSLVNDESVCVYGAYFILLFGGVFGGAVFFWLLCPIVGSFVLPFYLKFLTLFLIFLVGFFTYVFVEKSVVWPFFRFMNSMWFLGFITSSPVVKMTLLAGNSFWVQEVSWMELLSGKGALSVMVTFSRSVQRLNNISFSFMFSLFISLMVIFVLFF